MYMVPMLRPDPHLPSKLSQRRKTHSTGVLIMDMDMDMGIRVLD